MADTGVSLVLTVLNEAGSLHRLLHSIVDQHQPPDEVIVVDGGSTDGTLECLRQWQQQIGSLRLLEAPGVNIARGRNLGIAEARGPLIAVTDAGVTLPPDWLGWLVRAARESDADVVSGFFHSDPHTAFEVAMGATVLPALDDVDPGGFLPSSRSVAFRKSAWAAVGGYPEWLDYCEDLVFDLRLKQAGCRFAFQPAATVGFRPRGSLRTFFTQYLRYARGDGKAGLFARRHAIRYATYVLLLAAVARRGRRWPLILVLAGAAGYLRRPFGRLRCQWAPLSLPERGYALALLPIIRLVGDLAKMLGYPVGLAWRWRRGWNRTD